MSQTECVVCSPGEALKSAIMAEKPRGESASPAFISFLGELAQGCEVEWDNISLWRSSPDGESGLWANGISALATPAQPHTFTAGVALQLEKWSAEGSEPLCAAAYTVHCGLDPWGRQRIRVKHIWFDLGGGTSDFGDPAIRRGLAITGPERAWLNVHQGGAPGVVETLARLTIGGSICPNLD